MDSQWLNWAKQLQAIAQNGLTFAQDHYDIERYEAIRHIAAEMIAAGSPLEVDRIVELFAREEGYATPKVDVRAVVFRDDAILLVKEKADGLWTLPGGWADIGDSASESVTREVLEEAGFRVRVDKLLAVYDRSKHPHLPRFPFHIYKLFFRCEIIDGKAKPSYETEAVDFFTEDNIPDLSISRVTPAQIARMFEHYRHPNWPTEFD